MRMTPWALLALLVLRSPLQADSIDLVADRDNTLYESPTGELSNGAGDHFFAGVTDMDSVRRALVRFDLSAIPPGSTIFDAELTLEMSRTNAGPAIVTLHRVQSDWGEGSSHAMGEEGGGAPAASGDATWIHTFFSGQTWGSAGGDFSGSTTAATTVNAEGTYTWSSNNLTADVQQWFANPGQNFGWLLRGDESQSGNTKRFDSRDHGNAGVRPVLEVEFTPPVPVELQKLTVD